MNKIRPKDEQKIAIQTRAAKASPVSAEGLGTNDASEGAGVV